jgi:hypothetical protein
MRENNFRQEEKRRYRERRKVNKTVRLKRVVNQNGKNSTKEIASKERQGETKGQKYVWSFDRNFNFIDLLFSADG